MGPSSALEFIIAAPAQTQTGAEAAGRCGTGAARWPHAGLATSLPGDEAGQGTLLGVPRAAGRQAPRLPPPLRGERGEERKGEPRAAGKAPKSTAGRVRGVSGILGRGGAGGCRSKATGSRTRWLEGVNLREARSRASLGFNYF